MIPTAAPTAPGALTTVGNGTLLASAIATQIVNRSCPTAAFTDTTDTAANIIAAALPGSLPFTFELKILNNTLFQQTLAAGTGVTLTGQTVVPASCIGEFLVTLNAAGTVTINGLTADFQSTLFGAGTAATGLEGNINRQTSLAGVGNAADTTEDVLFTYSLPANSLSVSGKGLEIKAFGTFAANGDAKRAQISFGSTVVADTGATNANGGGWMLEAMVFKTGAVGSNTQISQGQSAIGSTHGGCTTVGTPTESESGAITVKVTGASTGSGQANDVLCNFFSINAMN